MQSKFKFPEIKLNALLGAPVLKTRYNGEYYTIQVIKSLEELYEHEPNPTISTELYQRTFQCPNIATQPTLSLSL